MLTAWVGLSALAMLGWHHRVHWIWLRCIGLLLLDEINRLRLGWLGLITLESMGLDSTGLACILLLLCLGWVGLGFICSTLANPIEAD